MGPDLGYETATKARCERTEINGEAGSIRHSVNKAGDAMGELHTGGGRLTHIISIYVPQETGSMST